MDRPIREHLSSLHQRVQELNQRLMENRVTQDERNHIESEIRAAQQALAYYRKALEIEQQLA